MKQCMVCGSELVKHKNESKKRYEKKQFCSTSCSRVFMKKHKIGWWSRQHQEFAPISPSLAATPLECLE